MRRILILWACVWGTFLCVAQSPLKYSRVNVDLTSGNAQEFVKGGFDLEHGLYLPNRLYISDLSEYEIERISEMGFEFKVLIDDVQEFYATQSTQRSSQPQCQQYNYKYAVPKNFELGSMGGFLTYSQMIDAMDMMGLHYPHLISTRQQVGSDLSHEGRRIDWVRISDNPDTNEDEPEILYTALHHAREPMSMMQMIYFMWYLLENYDTSPEIKYLVDNTELYFIPCVNPDGYIYNESIAPNGGGNWRKNMRDNNNDGIFNEKDDGVDLNRNYSFEWGKDDEGSSSNPSAVTYRGEEAFSEPEVRAVRDFIDEHAFSCALNYHAFGNFLLYPWGFSGSTNPDSVLFANYADHLSSHSGYGTGTTQQTLGYLANGTAGDWMYAMHEIIAVTPEIGDADWGFWPPESEIINLCNASLFKNLAIAHFTQNYAIARAVKEGFFTSREGKLNINIKRFGLEEGSMALSVESLSPELTILGSLQEVSLDMFDAQTFEYDYIISENAEHGDEFTYVIKLDNGFYEVRDTLFKVFSTEESALSDDAEAMDAWNIQAGSTWGVTDEASYTGQTSFTDSPFGYYESGTINEMTLAEPIDLTEALSAEMTFMAKWQIEDLIDYAVVEASTDGISYTTLCGEHSTSGSIFQRFREPIYDGNQIEWVQERISLDDFLGSEVYIRFALYTDAYFELDGIYIDDIRINVYGEDNGTTSVEFLPESTFSLTQYPNPASGWANVKYNITEDYQNAAIVVNDILGRVVFDQVISGNSGDVTLPVEQFGPGIYTTSILLDGVKSKAQRLVVVR